MSSKEPVITAPPPTTDALQKDLMSTRTALEQQDSVDTLLDQVICAGRQLMQQAIQKPKVKSEDVTSSRRTRRSYSASAGAFRFAPEEGNSWSDVLEALVDFNPDKLIRKEIYFSYAIFSVRLTIFSMFAMIGRYVLGSWITSFMTPFTCTFIGAVLVPLLTYQQYQAHFDAFIEPLLLWPLSCAAHGLFVGAGLAHLSLQSEPFIALPVIACTQALGLVDRTRLQCFILVIGSSLLVNIPIGYLFGWLNTPYYLLTVLYTLVALLPIQWDEQYIMWSYITIPSITILSKCLVYGIFGVENGLDHLEN